MRADTFAIAITKCDGGKRYRVQLLGLTAGQVVANASDLEESSLSWQSALRVCLRLLEIIPRRLAKKQIEFLDHEMERH